MMSFTTSKAQTKQVDYYVMQINRFGSVIIAHITEETEDKNSPEAIGKITYCSTNQSLVGTPWREKKCNMANDNFLFSKKGFELA